MILKIDSLFATVTFISLLSLFGTVCNAQFQQLFSSLAAAGPLVTDETLDIIASRGFKGEMYTYPLGIHTMIMYRIINPLADPATLYKYPLIYYHGILFNSANMISNSNRTYPRKPVIGDVTVLYEGQAADDTSLPFMLSNNNFDVWLVDARGTNNKYTTEEIRRKNIPSSVYWNFNLDTGSQEDLPRVIDFILQQTNSEKVMYVSYSESTTFMFMLLSGQPRIANKIAAFCALAPVAYINGLKGLTLSILLTNLVPEAVHGNFAIQPLLTTGNTVIASMCAIQAINPLVCAQFINSIGGYGSTLYNPYFFKDFFKSTSLDSFKQFAQIFFNKRFSKYDHGLQGNLQHYGSSTPPLYRLADILLDKIILVRGYADFLSTKQDQERLISEMGRKLYADIVIPNYNHFDFIIGANIVKNVNEPVVRNLVKILKEEPVIIRQQPPNPNRVKPVRVVEPGHVSTGNAAANSIFVDTGNLLSHLVQTPTGLLSSLSEIN